MAMTRLRNSASHERTQILKIATSYNINSTGTTSNDP